MRWHILRHTFVCSIILPLDHCLYWLWIEEAMIVVDHDGECIDDPSRSVTPYILLAAYGNIKVRQGLGVCTLTSDEACKFYDGFLSVVYRTCQCCTAYDLSRPSIGPSIRTWHQEWSCCCYRWRYRQCESYRHGDPYINDDANIERWWEHPTL